MSSLSTKIKMYAEANGVASVDFSKDVLLRDDMVEGVSNPYIAEWNLDIAKPDDSKIAEYEIVGNTKENNNIVIANRKSEYGSNTQQIENIIENGLVAEQARVQAIKDKYPRS